MNLGDIQTRVQNELRYAPNSQAHADDVRSVVNEVYLELMTEQPWDFRQETLGPPWTIPNAREFFAGKLWGFWTYPDRQVVITPTGTGLHLVNFPPFLGGFAPFNDASLAFVTAGQTLVAPDGLEYQIARADNGSGTMYLVQQWGSPLGAQTCTIRFDRYVLPFRVQDVLGIVLRDPVQGEIPLVNRSAERRMLLREQDSPGRPQAWLYDDPEHVRAPVSNVTLTDIGGGIMPAGVYRYRYAFLYKGLIGPASASTEITVTGGASQIRVGALETANVDRGVARTLYREFNRSGLWIQRTTTDMSFSTFDDNVAPTEQQELWNVGDYGDDSPFYVTEDFGSEFATIRFWPRPAQRTIFEVRALLRPRALMHVNDVPRFPSEFHPVLVFRAVARLAARWGGGDLVRTNVALDAEFTKRMRARHMNKLAEYQERGRWGRRRSRGLATHVTFNG